MSEVTMTDRSRPRWGLLAAVIFGVLALMAVVGNLLPDETPRLPGAATTSTPSATPTTPAPTTEPPAEAPTETPAPDADLAARVETATLTNYGLDSWGVPRVGRVVGVRDRHDLPHQRGGRGGRAGHRPGPAGPCRARGHARRV